MKKLFTKTSFVAVMLFVLGATMSANAQTYPVTTLGTNVGATAVTKDAAGNVYVIEDAGSPESPSSAKTGQIVEYLAGTSTGIPLTGTNAIPYVDQYVANSFPFGIAIDGSGNIFVTTFNDFAGPTNILGNILKFTRGSLNGNGTYSYTVGSSPWVTGNAGGFDAFEGLVVDSNNNLFVTAFDNVAFAYVLVEYPSGSTTPSEKYTHLGDGNVSGGSSGSDTYSNPYVLAIDSHDNIYAATSWDESNGSDGGKIIELSKSGGYTTESNAIATSAYCVALGFDASNNLYAINGSSNLLGTLSLVEYAAVTGNTLPVPGVSTSGVTHYSNSNAHNSDNGVFGAQDGNFFPFGLAIPSDNVIFASAGTITTGSAEGDFVQFASTISSITATTPFLKSGTETFTATFGSAVSGVTASNFSTTNPGGGISGASVGTPTTTDGGIIWSVPVNTGSGDGTLGLNLQNSTNLIPGISTTLPFTGGTATVDNTAPTIMISSPSQSSIIDGAGSVTYTVTYADANFSSSSLVLSNITLNKGSSANGTVGLTGSGTSYTVTISGITGSGTLGISIAANTAVDKAGNDAPASGASTTFTVLTPSITVPGGTTTLPSTPSGTPGSSTSFNISGSNLSPASGNLTVTAPANVQVSPDGSTWTSSSYTVAYSGSSLGSTAVHVRLSGTGTVGTISGNVSVSGGGATAVNQAVSGSLNSPSTTISSLTAVNSTLTNATSVQYTATFAASISGLAASNFSFVPGSIASASVTSVTEVSGTTWTVTVNTGSGDGTIQLELSNSGGISPSVSNTGFTGTTYTIDKTAPTVSIGAPSVSYINSSATVSYTVTWSDANLNTSSISLTPAQLQFGGSGYAVNLGNVIISGSGATRTISITGVTGNGSMSFSIPSGTASDNAGNSAAASNTSSTVVIDNTPPTVTIGPPSTTLTNTGPVTFDVSYSDANFASAALTSTNITLNASGASASVAVTPNSPTDYTVTLSGITGNGTLGISVQAGTSVDHAGNTDIGAGPSTLFTVDNIPPTVSSITATTPGNANPTNATSVTYTVTFDEAVTGVTSSAFTATTSGVSTTGIGVSPVSGSVYTVTLSGISGTGTLRLDLNASATGITDLAGNAISGGFTSGDTYTINTVPPVVSSITATTPSNTNPTNATSVTYTVTFSEAVTGVSNIGFTATTTGVATSGIVVTPVSGSVYSVTVNGISGNGTLRLDLNNGNTGIFDLAGNPISGGFTSGDVYNIDQTPPTVLSSAATGANPTNASSLTYTVTFSEAVTGVDQGDFTATTTGGVTTSGIVVSPVSGSVYSVTVNGVSGSGSVRLDVNSSGTGIQDIAGNALSGGFTGGDIYSVDQTSPSVVSVDVPANGWYKAGQHLDFVVHFTENTTVTGTPSIPVTIGTNTVNANFLSGNGSSTLTFEYVISSGDNDYDGIAVGSAIALNGGTLQDAVGNNAILTLNSVGSTTGVLVDTQQPTVAISAPSAASIDRGTSGTVTYTVTYADANFNTSNLVNSGITLIPGGTASGTVNVTGSGTSYTVTISNITGLGTLGISVGAGYASDLAGNTDAGAAPSATFNVVSNNAVLFALRLSSGAIIPVFASGTSGYTASVAHAISSVMVTPTSSDPNATITVNGTAVTSGTTSGPVMLSVGDNPITVMVTAQDGFTTKTYTVTVTRAPSSEAYLANLAVQGANLSPSFVYNTLGYTAGVAYSTSSVTVTPAVVDPNATVTVNGTTVANRTASGPVMLSVGDNTITVVVKAQNGVTKQTYTVTVTRAQSTEAYLANLSVQGANLSPSFAYNTLSYTAGVAFSTPSVTVTPAVVDPTATVTVNGTTVANRTASGPVMLSVGDNIITIVVTAQDGVTTQTYTVTVTRAPTSDAHLTRLNISSGTLSPAFDYLTTSYTASVNTATVTVTPTTSDANAIVTIDGATVASNTASGPINLDVGPNTITTIVTAQDGTSTDTYTITVTLVPPGDNSVYEPVSVVKPDQEVTLEDDGITVHQAVSPNGDGINDFLTIDNITNYPDNHLVIMNRNGMLVYEAKGYDNSSRIFDGHSNKTGQMQLPGTYFYSLDYTVKGIAKHKTGFIVLKY